MQELCPLCMKKGLKKRMRAVQINLHEALWICEAEECPWPFGYEELVFISRVVGKTWSCYWDSYKPPATKTKEYVPVSMELSLYTPPVTPCGEPNAKDCGSDTLQLVNNAVSKTRSNSSSNASEHTNTENCSLDSNAVSKRNSFTEEKTVSAPLNDKNIGGMSDLQISNHTDSDNLQSHITKNNTDTSVFSLNDKESNENGPSNKEPKIKNETEKIPQGAANDTCTNSKTSSDASTANDKNVYTKDNVEQDNTIGISTSGASKVTTMKIEGFPEVTVAYVVPSLITEPTHAPTVETKAMSISDNTNVSTCLNSANSNTTVPCIRRRQILDSKKYKKFNFGAVKKKLKTAQSTDITDTTCNGDKSMENNVKTSSLRVRSVVTLQDKSNDTKKDVKVDILKDDSPVSLPDTILADNPVLSTSINIDSFLDDFLSNSHNVNDVSDTINDDWINSILS